MNTPRPSTGSSGHCDAICRTGGRLSRLRGKPGRWLMPVALAWFACSAAAAAGDAATSPGNVLRIERAGRGALVAAERGALRIEFIGLSTVRLTASPTAEFPPDSTHPDFNGPYYIEDYSRPALPVTIERRNDHWRIQPAGDGACAVEVSESPLQFRVIAREATLLRSHAGGGIEFHAGRTTAHFALPADEHFIGFGAHRHPLDMRGHSIVLATSELGQEGEGGGFPVPWVMSSRGYALFLNNVDPTTRFDLGATQRDRLTIDAGDGGREGWNFDLHVFAGDSYAELMQGYIALTGKPILAEKWFFGNIQSKCCDWRADDIRYIASRFREFGLPLDSMILDLQWREVRPDMWEWTPAFDATESAVRRNNLKWAPSFGDVPRMFRTLDELGVKVGLHENTMSTYSDDADGPGAYLDRSFPDVSDPEVVARLWQMHRPFVAQGADFWWHDQGERMRGQGANGYPITNLNGSLWAKLVVEGMRREFQQSVPVLARSGPDGGHRYISPWPGDVPAGLAFAKLDLDFIRNGGLAGYATIGADMGGFYRGHTPDAENEIRRICDMLLVFPVIRTHGAYYKLPWMFSGEAQLIYAKRLQLRYRLLPYLYSAAIEAHETGRPILAPLCFDFGSDPKAYTRDFDFLLGRDLLVAPVTEREETRDVYLPAGAWRDFWTDERHEGGRTVKFAAPLASERSLPILVQEGAILPLIAPGLNIPSELFDGYSFHLYPASGRTTRRTFKDRARALDDSQVMMAELAASPGAITFKLETKQRTEAVYFHGVARPSRVSVNGRPLDEQSPAATGQGWSFGASDLTAGNPTPVLRVRLPAATTGSLTVEVN